MTLELWNSVATTATFLVIAATAIVALVQLRHARGNNQILAMDELRREASDPQFLEAQHYVLSELTSALADPSFRHQLTHVAERTSEHRAIMSKVFAIGNFYSYVGLLIKRRLLDADVALDLYGPATLLSWERLLPITAIVRRRDPSIWTNFEYAVVMAQNISTTHKDAYPRNVRRLDLPDSYIDADSAYEAAVARQSAPEST